MTCSDIADPANGQIVFSPDQTAPFTYGTLASFSCFTSYGLDGETTRHCGGNGSSVNGVWSGSNPTCNCEFIMFAHICLSSISCYDLAIQCFELDSPENGSVEYSGSLGQGINFGDTATYSCETGFGLSGNAKRTCIGNGTSSLGQWNGIEPTCEGTIELKCTVET